MTTHKPDPAQLRRIDNLIVQVGGMLFRDIPTEKSESQFGQGIANALGADEVTKQQVETWAKAINAQNPAIQIHPETYAIAASTSASYKRVFPSPTGYSSLRLTLDRASAGNRWSSSANAIEAWESTRFNVDLVVGAEGKFATVEVVASGDEGKVLPSNWRFEAVALGPDEMPEPPHRRAIGNPKMEGMPIPLVSSGAFRLDQPIRIALYVSDAGQKALGCLVFVAAPE